MGLGMHDPGASVQCWKCGCWMAARAQAGDADALARGLVAIGVGIAAGVAVLAIANAVFGGGRRR